MPTREQLLAWGIRAKKNIDLGEGMSLTIQQLNAQELQEVVKAAKDMKNYQDDSLPLCASIICKSAINDDGTRIFQDEDVSTLLRDWSYAKLGELVEPVFNLNGLLKENAELTEKN